MFRRRSLEERVDAYEKYLLVRNKERPRAPDLIPKIFDNFLPYREGSPYDPNLIAGSGRIGNQYVFVIAQNWKMITAHGYSLASKVMRLAEKYHKPIVTLIDTQGGDPLKESAEFLQCWKISDCIYNMAGLRVPTISIITGEGGSGGAIALQVADRTYMLENAVYSVISPEGCARILFKDLDEKSREEQLQRNTEMANLLRPTAADLLRSGIIDGIIKEPGEGAHTDHKTTAKNIRDVVQKSLYELKKSSIEDLLVKRYKRFMGYGMWGKERRVFGMKIDAFKRAFGDIMRRIGEKFSSIKRENKGPDVDVIAEAAEQEEKKGYTCECLKKTPWEEYIRNFRICPNCKKTDRKHHPHAYEWIDHLVDKGSFEERDGNLVPLDPLNFVYRTDEGKTVSYKDYIKKNQKKAGVKEALVVGTARIYGREVVLAVSEFGFAGGTLSSVVGEKFARAVNYANEKNCPLISISLTGGARMQEGIFSLMQMAKTNMALTRRKVPYISILADPTMAGSLSSYITRADVHIAESGAEIAFAGTRVVEGALKRRIRDEEGNSPPWYFADFYLERGGINEIVPRVNMKEGVYRYLNLLDTLYRK